jgi:SH3-like domain-containing protein
MKRLLLLLLLPFALMIPTSLIRAADAPAKPSEKPKIVVVKEPKVSLRAEASSSAKTLKSLTVFTPVQIIKVGKKWTQVKDASGKTGYVESKGLADSRFVATKITGGRAVNLRSGSSASSPISIELKTDYPLRVLEKKDRRVKVEDWEGDTGWAHESYLTTKRFVMANPPGSIDWINVREGPGMDAKGKPLFGKRFMVERGASLQVIEEKDGWLHIRYSDGDEGWCSAKIVWGWLDK